jgi:hypothetical protein
MSLMLGTHLANGGSANGSEALRAACSIFFMRTKTITIDLVVIIITLCSYTCHSLVTRYNIRLTLLST